MSHYHRPRPARTRIATFRHIETGEAFAVVSVTVSAQVERNPYYPGEFGEEEMYSVEDMRVVDESGRDVTGQVFDWEVTEYYTLLIEEFQEREEGDKAARIDEQIARIRERV